MQILSSDPASFSSSQIMEPGGSLPDLPVPSLGPKVVNSTPPASPHAQEHHQGHDPGSAQQLPSLDQSERDVHQDTSPKGDLPSSQESERDGNPSQSFSASVGYLSNRWNLGSSFSTPSTLGRGPDDSLRYVAPYYLPHML